MTRKNNKTTPEDNQAHSGMGQNVHNRPPLTRRHSDPPHDGLGKKFHNPTLDADRYAWLRGGGFFHDLMMGRVAASGATGAEFDAAVDQAMREESDKRERDADRYAWLRSGGLFHHVMGVAGASGATGPEFDSLVERGMAEGDA